MNFQTVIDLIKDLSTSLSVPIYRAEQKFDKPQVIFGTYKVLVKNNGVYSDFKELEIEDPTKYQREFSRIENFSISLSFIGNDIKDLYPLADLAMDYLNVSSWDKKQELGIKVDINGDVEDRTVFLDNIYEYKVGFDFNIIGIGKLQETLDAVDMDATISGVSLSIE